MEVQDSLYDAYFQSLSSEIWSHVVLLVFSQKLVGYAMTERPQLCRDQDSNLGCLGHNEKY